MNLLQFFTNVKQSIADSVFPVKLIPAEREKNWGLFTKVKRHPLICILLAIAILSAILNVVLLMKHNIRTVTEEEERDLEKLKAKVDAGERRGKVQFVAKKTTDTELTRILSLAREIPAAKLDAFAISAIRAVYDPLVYGPKVYQEPVKIGQPGNDQVDKTLEGKDEKVNKGIEGSDLKTNNKRQSQVKLVADDEENEPKRIKMWTKRKPVPPDLYPLAPDIFDAVPKKFEIGLKNPCWRSPGFDNWKLQCLPYFFLLGMPKCGTSDVWFKLIQHPQVMPVVKEPHFWSRSRIGFKLKKIPFSDYLQFPETLYSEIQKGRNDVVYGDGSASTMWDNRGWEKFFPSNISEPPFVIADLIREIIPDAKLIIILRNPVERLYSEYIFRRGPRNSSAIDFHRRVLKSIKSYEGCRERQSVRHCIYENYREDDEVRIRVGFYSLYLREWVRTFPIDQMALLSLTEWSDYCTEILPQLYEFLELDEVGDKKIQEICGSERINDNSAAKRRVGNMLPETRKILQDLYKPFNEDLTQMIGKDIFE